MPDVSIVIPAYNSGETIGRTLNSLRAQQHARWEAIVVDDGSSDKTADIVAEVARGDRRIHLIKQPNAGAGAARNTGLAHAQGEWIIFLDADDTLSAGHLSRMLRAVRDDPGANVGASLYHCGWRRRREGVLWWSPYPARPISDPFGATIAVAVLVLLDNSDNLRHVDRLWSKKIRRARAWLRGPAPVVQLGVLIGIVVPLPPLHDLQPAP